MKVRFAPSPTGYLQVGNARIALINWLHARKHGGEMLLRLDDTDAARSTEEYARAVEEDLRWLGLDWDSFARQSDRHDRYEAALDRLREAGRIYPCYETAEELEIKRKTQQSRGKPPVYDRAALRLSEEERAKLEAEGLKPHWRFLLESGEVAWDDLVRGRQAIQMGSVSDPVLVREDGRPLYTLTSVVDDIELAATDIIRGEDHVTNSAAQVQLFQALGAAPPRFAHLPLMTDLEGRKLSKRTADVSLRALREQEGIEPMALNSYLARLGTPDPIQPEPDLNALVESFDIGRFGRAAPKFDWNELNRLNAETLHALSYEAVAGRLAALGLDRADAAFWQAVRANLERLADAKAWHDICFAGTAPWIEAEDADFLARAAELLPPEPWDAQTWAAWTTALKQETGRKGAKLFKPLRKALTGREHGPELRDLLPLIGRERARRRLLGEPG